MWTGRTFEKKTVKKISHARAHTNTRDLILVISVCASLHILFFRVFFFFITSVLSFKPIPVARAATGRSEISPVSMRETRARNSEPSNAVFFIAPPNAPNFHPVPGAFWSPRRGHLDVLRLANSSSAANKLPFFFPLNRLYEKPRRALSVCLSKTVAGGPV